MSNKIILKKSSVSSKVPLTTDLDYGEVALNYADGKLYYKTSSNTIKSFTEDSSVVTLSGTQTLTNKTLTSPTISGGTIDNTVIGGTTRAAGSFTTLNASGTSTFTGPVTINNGTGSGGSDEGGELQFALATTNTTLSGAVVVDVYQNRLRIFERDGNNRGVYIDLTAASDGVASNLLAGGSSSNSFANIAVSGQTTVVADNTNDTLTLVGSGIAITTNATTDTITLTNSGVTSLTAGTGISVSGSTGGVTITNSAPDQTVSLTGSGSVSVSGTYPNFTISGTDTNTTYTAGTGLSLVGTTFSVDSTIATKTYADAAAATAVSNLIDAAPTTLDTLNELAAALGDDPNFATTITTSIGTKVPNTRTVSAGTGLTGGGALSGDITISHADTSSAANLTASSRTYVTGLTFDTFGHVTAYTTGSETVTDTNTTYTLDGSGTTNSVNIELVAGGSGSGTDSINVVGSGATTVAWDEANQRITISSTDNDTTYSTATTSTNGLVKLGDGTTQTTAANAVTTTASRSYAVQLNGSGQMVVNVPWVDTNTTYSTATSTVAGLIQLRSDTVQTTVANAVTSTASRTYGIQLNGSGQAVVNVPWTDTIYVSATSVTPGLIELASDTVQTVAANAVTTTASRTYGIQVNASGQAVVNVPWTDTTYSAATSTTLGLIELGSDTVQTVAANAVTATASRSYALQVNSSGQGVINVPWVDTTYSTATTTVPGLVELGSDTVQTVAANAVSSTASRSYAVQLNASGQMVTNVPWTDTNTTYAISAETASGGVNLRLTGSDSSTDDVKFAAGTNITLTRTDASTITIAASGGGSSPWTFKTANYTAVDKDRIIATTTGGSFTITLPATPSAGAEVIIADGDNWQTNNLTINRNGSTIKGLAENLIMDIAGVKAEFVYSGSTWLVFAFASGADDTLATSLAIGDEF